MPEAYSYRRINSRIKDEFLSVLGENCSVVIHVLSDDDEVAHLWLGDFLCHFSDFAKFLRKVKICVEIFTHGLPDDSDIEFIPSTAAVLAHLGRFCNFEIKPEAFIPSLNSIIIHSVTWNAVIGSCFEIKVPTRTGTELIVEFQSNFDYEEPGSLGYESQIQVIRANYVSSINGVRFRLDDDGNFVLV